MPNTQEKFSGLDLKDAPLSGTVDHALFKIKEIRAYAPTLKEKNDQVKAQNLIRHYTSIVRSKFDLPPLPSLLSDEDVEMLCEVDDWQFGKTINDLLASLEKTDPGTRMELKQRITDTIELHTLQEQRNEDIQKKMDSLSDRFKKFVTRTNRPEKIEFKNHNPVVSGTWKLWITELESLQKDLSKSVEEFKALERNNLEVPEYAKEVIKMYHHTKNLIDMEKGEN